MPSSLPLVVAGPPGAPVLMLLHGWTATSGLNFFACFQPLSRLQLLIDAYRKAQENAKPLTGVRTNKVGIYTLVHCLESREKCDQNHSGPEGRRPEHPWAEVSNGVRHRRF